MEDAIGTDEVSIPAENTRNSPRIGVMRRKVGTKTFPWTAAAINHTDEDIPAATKPRLETSISTAADVGEGVAAQTTDTLTTASPSDIVDVAPAPRDVVTVSSPLQSTGAPRTPVRKWKPEEDAKLTEAVKKHGNNWVTIATLLPGRNNRQCRERWMQFLCHSTNRTEGKRTPEEDAKLIEGLQKHGKDWVAIAALISGRTNVQCCHRWADNLDPILDNRKMGKWTAEEDAKLMDSVTECGNDWVAAAALVSGRTNTQCRERWMNSLNPSINRKMGKWTAEEESKLSSAVNIHGNNWLAVAALVPGRTNNQCCHRWADYVDPNTNRKMGRWRVEEDTKLIDAVVKYDKDWDTVAALIPGRTYLQCRERWVYVEPTMKGEYAITGRRTSISRAAVDVGPGAAAQTTDTLTTASPSYIVDVVPKDGVTASSPLQSTEAPRTPVRKWKPEEDAKLTDAVEKHGNNWVTIATLLPGRKNKECRQRWGDNLDPNTSTRKMGKWTAEEDAKLVDSVTEYGKDIPAAKKPRLETSIPTAADVCEGVAAQTTGRLATASLSDIVAVVPSRAPRRKWTTEEDATLTDAVKECGKDWVAVAALVPGRANEQCRQRWMHSLHPTIHRTKGKWTAEEDAKLVSAVKKHGNNWLAVAALVPGRMNKDCRSRWADNKDPSNKRKMGKWTAAEDVQLIEGVQKHGKVWVTVAALVSGRTNLQCRERWVCVEPTTKGKNSRAGRWRAEEDAKLTDAIRNYGKDWVAVAPMVPGRTNLQCRQRWVYLNPSVDRTPESTGFWTPEEDAKLIEGLQKHGKNWVAVAELVPGRTNGQCRKRWQVTCGVP